MKLPRQRSLKISNRRIYETLANLNKTYSILLSEIYIDIETPVGIVIGNV